MTHTCTRCGMNYTGEHLCTSDDPLREEHTTAYMVGVEAGKDAMRAEVTKLRVVEAAKEAAECSRDSVMAPLSYCLEDLDAALRDLAPEAK